MDDFTYEELSAYFVSNPETADLANVGPNTAYLTGTFFDSAKNVLISGVVFTKAGTLTVSCFYGGQPPISVGVAQKGKPPVKIQKGKNAPIAIQAGAILYYVLPSPAPKGEGVVLAYQIQ